MQNELDARLPLIIGCCFHFHITLWCGIDCANDREPRKEVYLSTKDAGNMLKGDGLRKIKEW